MFCCDSGCGLVHPNRWRLVYARSFVRERFKLRQSAIDLLHERLDAFAPKGIDKRSVIPESATLATVEPGPELFSFLPIIH
jgi:hypothetical protein